MYLMSFLFLIGIVLLLYKKEVIWSQYSGYVCNYFSLDSVWFNHDEAISISDKKHALK